jgi:RHS repeat-associated protein
MDFDSVSVCSAAFAYIGARPRTYHPQMTVRLAGGPRLAFETWGRLITKPTPEGTLNYTFDLAGNVSSIYSSSQHGASMSYTYDAFGNLLSSPGPTPNNYLYRGEQYDPDLGLYYLRARYYNPQTGRFMSRDPDNGHIGYPNTLHKYLYAGGDPINRLDPTGRFDLEYIEISTGLTFGEGAYALGYGAGGLTWCACAVEFSWALAVGTVNLLANSNLSSPPPVLTVTCGWITLFFL